LKPRSALAAGALCSRTLALLCCLLLVLAQIGAVTHALSHYRAASAASAIGASDLAANVDQSVDEAGSCALCLAFGVLSNVALPALLALAGVAIAVSALAAISLAPAVSAPCCYRARAPPSLLAL